MKQIYKNIQEINIIEDIASKEIEAFSKNCIVGDNDHLYIRLKNSIKKAKSIDIIVAFLMESGVRLLEEDLKEVVNKNIPIRILTGNYLNITQPSALYLLKAILGDRVDLRFYKDKKRSFHPKAYIFEYEDGGDIFIGSSNISKSALTSGIEWNYRLTKEGQEEDFKYYKETFEKLFFNESIIIDDNELQNYSKQWVKPRLYKDIEKREEEKAEENKVISYPQPKGAQIEALYELKKSREEGMDKALVVAATGIGKTYLAAFDSIDFNRVLFVAHRAEILNQAERSFKNIITDVKTGFFMNSTRENECDILFATVQTLGKKEYLCEEFFKKDYFDYIIIDEFHHAAAGNYKNIIDYFKPKFMLGLTATPERMDGKNILERFDDRIAAEMRLPEAIDKKLLSPFQYFAVSDSVDLSKLKWTKGGYDRQELENVYTNNDIRVNGIISSLYKYVTDIDQVIGLGFCVSVDHAKYMADKFNNRGIPSIAVLGESNRDERNNAKRRLVNGEVKFIFTVDLYNEGVDIPEINTVLFLRPTESLTIFLQQLGRGLRLSEGKECLTVLDFVGQAHKNYDFEQKFKALIGKSKHSVEYNINNGFLNLPKGCYIHLEKKAKDYILRNIKSGKLTKAVIISKLKYFREDTGKELTLSNFLEHYNYTLVDVYGKSGDRSFTRMKAQAGVIEDYTNKDEVVITKRIKNLFHINSRKFIEFAAKALTSKEELENSELSEEERRIMGMLYYSFYLEAPEKLGYKSFGEALHTLYVNNKEIIEEAVEILQYNYAHIDFVNKIMDLGVTTPLDLHCTYSVDQIMAALGYFNETKKPSFREGVKYFKEIKLDAFFITLNKSEKDYSPSTLYEDYAINEKLFHWQSQSRTSVESETGQRYINHFNTGNKIILFVRDSKKKDGITAPYTYLGEAEYVSHSGNTPISFIWRLKEEMPAGIMEVVNKGIG